MKKKIIITCAILLGMGAIALVSYFFMEDPIDLNWKKDGKYMYSLKNISIVEFVDPMTGFTSHSKIAVSGTLNFRIIEIDESKDFVKVGMMLSPITVSENGERRPILEERYSSFFIVDFDLEGSHREYHFDHSLAREDELSLSNLIKSLSFVIPISGMNDVETEEEDANGIYLASYEKQGHNIIKKKYRYTMLRMAMEKDYNAMVPHMRIIRSKYTIVPSKKESWLDKFQGEELLSIGRQKDSLHTDSIISLVKIPFKPDMDLPIWEDDVTFEKLLMKFKDGPKNTVSAWEKQKLEYLKAEYQGHTMRTLLAEYNSGQTDLYGLVKNTKEYLSLNPKGAIEIESIIRKQEGNEETLAALTYALGVNGSPESQNVLIKLIDDEGMHSIDRIRASVSLGDLSTPTDATIKRINDYIKISATDDDFKDVATSAILALGRMYGKQLDTHSPDDDTINKLSKNLTTLIDRHKDDPQMLSTVIDSIGNTEDPSLSRHVAPYLKSDDPSVRESATRSLGMLKGDDAVEEIIDHALKDNEAMVRNAAIKALAKQQPSDDIVNAITSRADDEIDVRVRGTIIQFLGKVKGDYPKTVKDLKDMLPYETDPGNRAMIYKALYSKRFR